MTPRRATCLGLAVVAGLLACLTVACEANGQEETGAVWDRLADRIEKLEFDLRRENHVLLEEILAARDDRFEYRAAVKADRLAQKKIRQEERQLFFERVREFVVKIVKRAAIAVAAVLVTAIFVVAVYWIITRRQ